MKRDGTAARVALVCALPLGVLAGSWSSASCIIPDYCIRVAVNGNSICKAFPNASGIDAQGHPVIPIVDEEFKVVVGCVCFDDASADTLLNGDPDSLEYQLLELELDAEVRSQCLVVATAAELASHNCLSEPVIDDEPFHAGGSDECPNGCVFVNLPPSGSCPPDDECSLDDDASHGETGDGETTGQSPGSEVNVIPDLGVAPPPGEAG